MIENKEEFEGVDLSKEVVLWCDECSAFHSEANGCKSQIKAQEIEFLKWFYAEADFGPADGDVREYMKQMFTTKTGKALPEGYDG